MLDMRNRCKAFALIDPLLGLDLSDETYLLGGTQEGEFDRRLQIFITAKDVLLE